MPDPVSQFLQAEERATATLMGFYAEARDDLEAFIRRGDLSTSDSKFYRQLLDETNRLAAIAQGKAEEWVAAVIPEAASAGFRTHSPLVPRSALEALSRSTLSLITQTTDGIRQAVRQAIAAGILHGESGQAVRDRILASGLTNIPHWPNVEYRAGVIARTETMGAYNAGALDGIVANGARFVRWIASPDEATCEICLPRDNVVFRVGGATAPTWGAAAPMKAWFDENHPTTTLRGFDKVPKAKMPAVSEAMGEFARLDDAFGIPTTIELQVAGWAWTASLNKERGVGHISMHLAGWVGKGKSGTAGPADTPVANLMRHEFSHLLLQSRADALRDDPRWLAIKDYFYAHPDQISQYAIRGFNAHERLTEVVNAAIVPGGPVDPRLQELRTMLDPERKLDGGMPNDPYPHAQPLPHIPAHPRCRCTIRAEYRGPDGQVVRQGVVGQDPKLPADAMGGDMASQMPTAFGEAEAAMKAEWDRAQIEGQAIANRMLGFVDGRTMKYDVATWGKGQGAPTAGWLGGHAPKGGDLSGFENALKTWQSTLKKLRIAFNLDPTATAAELAGSVRDLVRFTMRFEPGDFASSVRSTKARLLREGYKLVKFDPIWREDYKGINTNWISPDGRLFELQFHTPYSFASKEATHPFLDLQKGLAVGSPEWRKLQDEMVAISRFVELPPGWRSLLTKKQAVAYDKLQEEAKAAMVDLAIRLRDRAQGG